MPPSQTEIQASASSSSSSSSSSPTTPVVDESLLQSSEYDAATAAATTPTSAAGDIQSSECNADAASSNDEEHDEQETIIVFDWDDTILSSSWLAGLGYRLDSNMSNAPASLFAALETLSTAVCELLRLAHQHGRVVVITNAETGWVELSAQKFIPAVVPVLNELGITIFSARSTFEPQHPENPLKWKQCAFETVLSEPSLASITSSSSGKPIHKNVLSLGDSHVEREAVRLVTSEMANTLCKSVKFAERPTCEQLTRQLTLVTNCFSYILTHQNHLDLQLTVTVSEQNQQQAKEEEEKMRCQEASGLAAHDDGCGGYVPSNSSLCMDEDDDEEEEKVLEAF